MHAQPVGRDRALCVGELHGAAADLVVQEVLDGVLLVSAGVAGPRLRPQVGDLGGPCRPYAGIWSRLIFSVTSTEGRTFAV